MNDNQHNITSDQYSDTDYDPDTNKSIMRSIMKVVLVLAIFIVILIIGVIFTYAYYLNEIDKDIVIPEEEKITLTIEKGMGIEDVSEMLTEQGIISRPEILKAYMFLNSDKIIQAGYYKIDLVDLNLIELVDIFQKGSFEKKLTFPEGWRIEQYGDYLEEEMNPEFSKRFMESDFTEEGYMFPDTYIIEDDYLPENLASFMRNTLDKKFTDEMKAKALQNGMSEEDVLIFASIVEREMHIEKDRPIVAGILIKRRFEGWPLQADATLQYAKGNESDWWPVVTRDDYRNLKSPYNTYLNKGLPPTPISNPSIESIEAVIDYVETPYWYYISGTDGVTRYAETLEEHNKNIRDYLK